MTFLDCVDEGSVLSAGLALWAQPIFSSATCACISYMALIQVGYSYGSQMGLLWQVHEWRILTVLIRF